MARSGNLPKGRAPQNLEVCLRANKEKFLENYSASPFPAGWRKVLKEAGKEGMSMLLIS